MKGGRTERRHAGGAGLAALLALLAVVALGAVRPAPAAALPEPPLPFEQYRFCMETGGRTPNAADLSRLFDHEPGGVVGADYQRAHALPDGRVLWTFQDAAIRRSDTQFTIIHNLGVMQDGACFAILYQGTRSAPRAYIFADLTTPFDHWFWPLDSAVASDGRLHIYVAEMAERSPAGYLVHTEPMATRVAVFDPALNRVVEARAAPDPSPALYGWATATDGQWTYLYAHCYRQFGYDLYVFTAAFDAACAPRVTVARVPSGQLGAPYQYWDGTTWQADPTRAAALGGLAATRVNASQFSFTGNRWFVVNKEGDWWGDTIYVHWSDRPTGPFQLVASIPEPRKCPECNTFFADFVPPRAVARPDGTLVFGLAHNRWDGTVSAWYRPTFHEVRAPAYALAAGETVRVHVADVGPDGARPLAAALNLTAVNPRSAGFLTAHACDQPRPTASNLNYLTAVGAPRAVANLALAGLDGSGDVCVFASAAVDVVVDLGGVFAGVADGAASGSPAFVPVTNPLRLVDTRAPVDGSAPARVPAGGHVVVPVPGGAAAPAVALNLTAVAAGAAGYLTAYPCDQEPPTASNLNYRTGDVVAALSIARPDAQGNVCVYSHAEADVVVDLAGAFAPAGFTALAAPTRLLDSRAAGAALPGGTTRTVATGVAAGMSAVALAVTAVDPQAPGYVTVYPCDQPMPTASNLNYAGARVGPGTATANLVLARPDAAGNVCVFTSATMHLVVDAAGSLPAGSPGYSSLATPARLLDTRVAGFQAS